MANTIFVTNNHVTSVGTVIQPSYAAPNFAALQANVAAPLSNLLLADRSLRYTFAYDGTNGSGSIMFRFPSTKTVQAIGYLGLERSGQFPQAMLFYAWNTYPNPTASNCTTSGSPITTVSFATALPSTVKVGMSVSIAGGVTVPDGTMIVSIAANRLSLVLNNAASGAQSSLTCTFSDRTFVLDRNFDSAQVDALTILPAPIQCRYFEVVMPVLASSFSISTFVAGPIADLGIMYSAGSSVSIIKQVVENKTIDGTTTLTTTGPNRQRFRMAFNKIPATMADTLKTVAINNNSLLIVHPQASGEVQECRLVGNELEISHDFSPPDLFSLSLNLETMP